MKRLMLFLFFFTLFCHAEAATRNILLIGFWPPTNEMLREFSPTQKHNVTKWQGKNWQNLGYNIYAYFPEFKNINSDHVGEGDFQVDFASTYNDFMRLTQKLKPMSIIGFGKGQGPWEIEVNFPNFFQSWFMSGDIPSLVGKAIAYPIPNSLKDNITRHSSLPAVAIITSLNQAQIPQMSPYINSESNPGDFLCGFLSYLIGWYHDEHSSPNDPAYNKASGFIHVSGALVDSQKALEITLKTLIENF